MKRVFKVFEPNFFLNLIGAMVLMISLALIVPSSAMAMDQPEALNNIDRELDSLFKSHLYADSHLKVKIGGQSRYRFEYRDNFNLNDRTYEDDSMNLIRNRFNIDAAYLNDSGKTPLHFFAEGQEAHAFTQSQVNKTNTFVNWVDLRQLFMEIKSPWDIAPVTLKVGRQVLTYGDERFVGPLDWTNTSRVFDAIKTIFIPNPQVQLDVFASRVVKVEKEKWDQAQNGDNFYGVYLSTKPFHTQMDQVLDSFLFIRNNTDRTVAGERTAERGELKEYTFGNRFKGKKWNWDYGTEYAIQLGRRSHDDIQSWAFHQELGYTLVKIPWTPRIYGEFNHASGDRNPTDGKSQTFDNLFPTNHNKYGFIDFISLKNMNDLMIGSSIKPHARLLLSSDFHWFLLDAKESSWFNAAGGVLRAANAGADTHLGEELDLLGTYKLTEHLSLMLGYSRFFSGPFVKDTGAHDDAHFFYTQSLLNF